MTIILWEYLLFLICAVGMEMEEDTQTTGYEQQDSVEQHEQSTTIEDKEENEQQQQSPSPPRTQPKGDVVMRSLLSQSGLETEELSPTVTHLPHRPASASPSSTEGHMQQQQQPQRPYVFDSVI